MKTVAFVFGRFNPPTIGHGKLLSALKATAQRNGADYYIFTSQSQDSTKNPLYKDQIFHYMSKMFSSERKNFQTKSSVRNVFDIATEFHGKYDKLIMVVGSDRVADFESILNTYNGVKSRHGFYEFKEIQIVSAGERDPDMEGASGMSASKMRAAAVSNDYDSFKSGVPSKMRDSDSKDMFNAVRQGMKLSVVTERYRSKNKVTVKTIEPEINIKPAEELTWQGYTSKNLSTSTKAFEIFSEIVNDIEESTFSTAQKQYLRKSMEMVDTCLGLRLMYHEKGLTESDFDRYMELSRKSISLLDQVGAKLGIDFNYNFLNEYQIEISEPKEVKEEKPVLSFEQFRTKIKEI
jgi:hypothetical protein